MFVESQVGQKITNFRRSHILGMPFVMKQNKALDPADIGLFSLETPMFQASYRPHLVEEPGLALHASSSTRFWFLTCTFEQ